ncbi:MAG: T9SS type A sorting domain-containing protein [Bacteroidetes bacterium]|nr:T9SS type A sorting domain-containing protein [Bacteroidota bacterium]MBL7103738.1 T9SS type A sorting domain-containing protein [Bacteroidales bacterium]
MKTFIEFKVLLLAFLAVSYITVFSQLGDDFCIIEQSEIDDYFNKNGDCNTNPSGDFMFYDDLDTYIPNFDNEPLHNPPLKTIKLNINIFQKNDGTGNFPDNQETRDGLNQIIQWVNGIYNVCDPCDPISGIQELDYTNIRFSIGEEGYERIYFYQNDQIWNSTNANTLLNEVLSVDPERSNYINVLISGSSGSYAYTTMPSYSNLEKNQFVFMFYWGDPVNYAKANQLAHELGHDLGLLHTYYGGGAWANCNNNDEYLSDIFGPWPGNCPHIGPPNIWGEDACEFPDDLKTNNLMGGNKSNCYISPKQAGQMHRALAVTSTRRFVEKVKSDIPLVISNDETWDFDIRLYRDVIIEPEVELTLACKLIMPYEGKIIVKPNAKLIIDDAVITTIDDEQWQGIEVWGNSTEHQYTINGQNAQGQLILKNNAIIENAVCAVKLWRPGYISTTGGIVQATDAIFRNNAKSVLALYYSNFNPNNPGNEMDNVCYFNNCTFELNGNYIPSQTFDEHVYLVCVKGIRFKACDFTLADVPGVSQENNGIAANSAGFSVSAVCTSPDLPCSEYDKCTFNGFYNAIYAGSTNSNTFSVNRAVFENNTYGINVLGVNNLSILFSDFFIGYNAADEEECEGEGKSAAGYGISLSNSTGFAIEENEFYKDQATTSGNYVGIRIAETQASDEIYLNYFEGLSYANYTEGQNWKTGYTWHGLAYFCNENTVNYEDFTVVKNDDDIGGIQSEIGSTEIPAGNTFTTNANNNFNNLGNHEVGYFYYTGNPPEYPEIVYNVAREPVGIQNQCLSHYGGGGGGTDRGLVLTPEQKQETEQEFATNLTDYNNIRALYENLKDGGNTEALQTEVETSWPSDVWELRVQLLGDSPHLSMEVLKAAADKTDVLPESIIFEIMAANPDELKKEELIKYLEDKENPLPGYMIDILRQVSTGTTYKTVLHRQMAFYNRNKTRAAHDIIRSLLNDTITDYAELRNWLDNAGGIRADEQIIATYMQEENYSDALALADMMPALYGFEGDELTEHNYFMDMLNLQINLAQEGRNIFELDSTEVNTLVYIADNSTGIAGSEARGILEFAYGYEYCNCLNVSDTAGYKSSMVFNPNAFEKIYGVEISVEPNPAKEWAAFNYTLPDSETEGAIKISDVSGKLVTTLTISGKQGQKIWDTRKIKSGVYFYTLNVSGFNKSGKIVISK